ncbi:FlaD/FlaE family flagellar protein [Methanofervidicoccus abyssi]|uniref:Archaeal flagellar protein FlaD n=1 Tax=Methanofervidicoccus abyssi TaxID=2082189 RepID=A0A401HPB1_9EURY|nr:FlaD/FlaE family flagellar protein [Methanofervidicoccus abyssi]GBF36088.1 archaeal flagellar protein FlaD [Methanofervidicoccus abyssi]
MISETEVLSSTSSIEEEYLTDDELEEYLENLKTKIPSFIVELLKNNLKNRRLTKSQLDRIVTRITDLYLGKRPEDKKTEELMERINELSKKLDALMKVAAITSATKISEDIKKEISKLEEEKEIKKEEKQETESEEIAPQEIEETVETGEEESTSEPLEKPASETTSTEIPPISEKKEGGISMTSEIQKISEKKYRLEELPEDTLSTMLVFKWLEFLIGRVGLNNLIDILDYYYNLGWISEKVVNRLIKISKNMKYLNEDLRKPVDKMIPEDHIVSLLYIEKLAGRPIPIDELENIDREINRIRKWAEELQFI